MSVSKQNKNSGFTIVELLVVIVIIAILASLAFLAYSGVTKTAKKTAFTTNISQIKKRATEVSIKDDVSNGDIEDLGMNNLDGWSGFWSTDQTTGEIILSMVSDGNYICENSKLCDPTSPQPLVDNNPAVSLDNSTIKNNSIKNNYANRATMLLENNCGYNGGDCLTISGTDVDASFQYSMSGLLPNRVYSIETYIKGENIGSSNIGATLTDLDWSISANNQGTFDYRKNSFTTIADKTGKINFKLRLGFWGSINSGKAYFDDIKVNPYQDQTYVSEYVRLLIDSNQLGSTDKSVVYSWLNKLDKYIDNLCYITSTNCSKVGFDINARNSSSYWGSAGSSTTNSFQPIMWNKIFVNDMLTRISNNDKELSFGIMHEIGHQFAKELNSPNLEGDKWIWNGEFWANMNMALGLYNLEYGFVNNGITYVGNNGSGNYKWINENYCSNINCTVINPDTFNAYLIRIQRDVGVDIFKKTFNDFRAMTTTQLPSNASNTTRLTMFMDKLFQNYNATVPVAQQKTINSYLTTANWNATLNLPAFQ